MDNDGVIYGERSGERLRKTGEESQGEYEDIWDGAMEEGVPEFNSGRPWGFDEESEGVSGLPMEELQLSELEELTDVAEVATETENGYSVGESAKIDDAELGGNFAQASRAIGFGLDTASRVYGLDMVIAALQNIDETGRDVENPLEAIYERLAPTAEAQENLYREMRRDLEKPQRAAFNLPTSENVLRVGRNAQGEFFEKDPENGWPERSHEASIKMIQALKKIIETLDTDPRFTQLREEAREAGMMPLEYLVREEVNPTLSYFLNQTGEATDIDIEELLTETVKRIEEKSALAEVGSDSIAGNIFLTKEQESLTNNLAQGGSNDRNDLAEAELGEILDIQNEDTTKQNSSSVDWQNFAEEQMSEQQLNPGISTGDDEIDVDEWFDKTGEYK